MDLDVQDDDDNDTNYQPGRESSRRKKDKQVQQRPSSSSPERQRIVKLSFSSIHGKMFLHKLLHIAVFADLEDDDVDNTGPASVGHQNDSNEAAHMQQQQQQPSETAVRNIHTAFSHPIDCELGNNCGVPCQFCEDFAFGMFGLGSREVEVIDYGTFLEELDGGHREDGQE